MAKQNSCTYCRQEEADSVCLDCRHSFCQNHSDPDDHYCNEPIVNFALSNGSVYNLRVPDYLVPLVRQIKGQSGIKSFLRTVAASPVTLSLIIIMWIWTTAQITLLFQLEQSVWESIFVLTASDMYIWTWFTSILSHGGYLHLFINTLVLAMFGPVVEHYIGSKKFAVVFVVAGVCAGLSQVVAANIVGESASVVGASGAIGAVLGIYATLEPKLRVYLIGIIPMPMWFAVTLFSVGSLILALISGVAAYNIAHIAHATGIFIGIGVGIWKYVYTESAK